MLPGHNYIEHELHTEKSNYCENPCPSGDEPEIAAHIANHQEIKRHDKTDRQPYQRPRPGGRSVGLLRHHHIEHVLHREEANRRQSPRPSSDESDLGCESG
jgi:hypothetical protein